MTYGELQAILSDFTLEQLSQTVTLYFVDTDEYKPVGDVDFVEDSDVLDEGHPVIRV